MSALVLYDTTQQWGWLGELYGIMVGNLVSHFGSWTAMPVLSYTAGGMNNYSAVIYIGSTYGEPLPLHSWMMSSRRASPSSGRTTTSGN